MNIRKSAKGRRKTDKEKIEMELKMKSIEKHQVKITIGVLVSVIIFIVMTTVQLTQWKTTTDNNFVNVNNSISRIIKDCNISEMKVLKLESDNIDVKVRLATIETKLTNIEVLLMEIKKDIRRKK